MTEAQRTPAADGPACTRCRHHFVTYEPQRPHGCHLFGIKTRLLPALVVRQESGRDCARFEPRAGHAHRSPM